jgi:hypothetical protein
VPKPASRSHDRRVNGNISNGPYPIFDKSK